MTAFSERCEREDEADRLSGLTPSSQTVPYEVKVLVCFSKHGPEYYLVASADDLRAKALKILQDRVDDCCFDQIEEAEANIIIDEGNGRKAYNLLLQRSNDGYEYERIGLYTLS